MLCLEVCKILIIKRDTKNNLFADIHTIMNYGVIFWGNSSYAKKLFIFQKKIIRIITNTGPRDSCREIFRNM